MVDVPTPRFQAQGQGVVNATDLNSTVQACQSLAQMRGLFGIGQAMLYLEGFTSPGDGGQGPFVWNSTAAGPDDGVNVIVPTGATVGAWVRIPLTATASQLSTIVWEIDGGGSPISTGIRGNTGVTFPCTITSVTLLADQSGSCVLDIWKVPYSTYNPPSVPTSANSICAAALPTISGATKFQDQTLTGWTVSMAAFDTLTFNINSLSTITRLTILLGITKH